jgi:hypothetical protein
MALIQLELWQPQPDLSGRRSYGLYDEKINLYHELIGASQKSRLWREAWRDMR